MKESLSENYLQLECSSFVLIVSMNALIYLNYQYWDNYNCWPINPIR